MVSILIRVQPRTTLDIWGFTDLTLLPSRNVLSEAQVAQLILFHRDRSCTGRTERIDLNCTGRLALGITRPRLPIGAHPLVHSNSQIGDTVHQQTVGRRTSPPLF